MSRERDEAHFLIDQLPDNKLAEVLRLLRSIEDDSDAIDLADEMEPEELAEFEAHLRRSYEDVRAGRTRPAEEILRELDERKFDEQ